MWPVFQTVLSALRHEGKDPVRALDGWLLVAIETLEPCTPDELSRSRALRMGPHGKGPELRVEYLAAWVDYATDDMLISSSPAGPGGRRKWSVTEAGRQRRRKLNDLMARAGGLFALVLRGPSVWAGAVARLEEQGGTWFGPPPPGRPDTPRIKRSPGDDEAMAERARENMERIKHIVVLMMENRSFDHMLGYLQLLDGQDEVTGPKGARPVEYEGKEYAPRHLSRTAFPKAMDPPHGPKAIKEQINNGEMDGFIRSFAAETKLPEPWRVMGYYAYPELPVYDYLAQNFLICDRWFSSVPSSTWPNRLYSLTGTCDPKFEGLFGEGHVLFDMHSFVRELKDNDDPRTWRWYSWDPGTLRLVDEKYRLRLDELFHDHFRRVVQHSIEPGREVRTEEGDLIVRLGTGLLEDAANGDLPSVAWIDPNFVDLSILESNSNDDHPPSDIRSGQELVMMVFRALAESPCWKDTMLIVTYDEHGGFYDHLPPGEPPEDNAHRKFDTYGVRVPAFIVSPLVEPCTVSHTVFDHTSIIRTILERFGVDGAVERMAKTGPRVPKAQNLGRLLTRDPGADPGPPDYRHVNDQLDEWRQFRARWRSAASPELARARHRDTWEPDPITGFPAEYLDAARYLREEGLPAGHP
jgi:phospholipase C